MHGLGAAENVQGCLSGKETTWTWPELLRTVSSAGRQRTLLLVPLPVLVLVLVFGDVDCKAGTDAPKSRGCFIITLVPVCPCLVGTEDRRTEGRGTGKEVCDSIIQYCSTPARELPTWIGT